MTSAPMLYFFLQKYFIILFKMWTYLQLNLNQVDILGLRGHQSGPNSILLKYVKYRAMYNQNTRK
jgi:hypothetical protein